MNSGHRIFEDDGGQNSPKRKSAAHTSRNISDAKLRAIVKDRLPQSIFNKNPRRLLLLIPLLLSVTGFSVIAVTQEVWFLKVAASILAGNSYASLMFFGHEVGHGAITTDRRIQNCVLFVSGAIFCLPPRLWRVWHNAAHHGHANHADIDPDSFGTYSRFLRAGLCKFGLRFVPGHSKICGLIYMVTFFSVQTQNVLWKRSRDPQFDGLNRRLAIIESLSMAVCWMILTVALGIERSFFAIVFPCLTANGVVMSYIVTNHMVSALAEDECSVLATTMSVTTCRFFDNIHFHFSHHVEHHLFPSLPTCHAPRVRRELLALVGPAYKAPLHSTALKVFFSTPRLYLTPEHLIDPFSGSVVHLKSLPLEYPDGIQ